MRKHIKHPLKEATNGRRRRHEDDEEKESRLRLDLSPETAHGIVVILCFVIGLLSLLSLLGLAGTHGQTIESWMGMLLGWGRFLFPILTLGLGVALFYPDRFPLRPLFLLGVVLTVLSLTGLFELFIGIGPGEQAEALRVGDGGGAIGRVLAQPFRNGLGVLASALILIGLFLIGLLLTLNISLRDLFMTGGAFSVWKFRWQEWRRARFGGGEEPSSHEPELEPVDHVTFSHRRFGDEEPGQLSQPKEQSSLFHEDGEEKKETPVRPRRRPKVDIPLDLLDATRTRPRSGDIEFNKATIKNTLNNFGIDVEMGDVSVGPTVTQYTFRPSEGVKLSQITTLQNDLALALAAHPIRIEAPIPGKALVGVEVPNKSVAVVRLHDVLNASTFKRHPSNLLVAMGQDVAGQPIVTDLETMPHLLIAGATGSGKSVMINSLIISLLSRNGPDDMRMILVDPKRVELTLYNGIPHLLTPVITEPKKTITALRWTVGEMDRRYELLSAAGKKNIGTYNQATVDRLSYIVVIIDELADLMAVAAKDVEAVIIRLAQMARAVGIHLIVATQRPSVDVITGLIKANITSRAAFTVASVVDSRTILDHSGAEKLLGRGDMLYVSSELSKPKRIQGAYVDEREVTRVVSYIKKHGGNPEYQAEIVERQSSAGQSYREDSDFGEEDDEIVAQAQEVIVRAGKASASLLQRRLRIGYARAARVLDILEERGIIGPAEGAKPREVYISPDGAMEQPLDGKVLEPSEEDDDLSQDDRPPQT